MKNIRYPFLFVVIYMFSSCSQTNEQLINEGLRLQEKEQYKEAIAKYTKVLNKNAKLQRAYYNRGQCYSELGEYQKSLNDFNSIIRLKTPQGSSIIFEFNPNTPAASEEALTQVPYNDALYERAIALYLLDSLKSSYDDFKNLVSKNYEEKVMCIIWQADIWHEAGNDSIACAFAKQATKLAFTKTEINEAQKILNAYCR